MILSSKGAPADWLSDHLSPAVRLDIATGYLTAKGLSLLLKPLQDKLKQGTCRVRVLYGELPSKISTVRALNDLHRLVTRYPNGLEIRRARSHSRLFHPKLYLISDAQGQSRALVGSSNTTQSGLLQNLELNITSSEHVALQTIFAGWWATAEPLPPAAPLPLEKGNILSQIEQGLAAGLLVDWIVPTKGFSIPLPTDSLRGLPIAPLNVGGFHLRSGVRLTLDIAPDGVMQRITALQNWGNSRVRKITISTPWGRLATQFALEALHKLTVDVQTRLRDEQEQVSAQLRESESSFEDRIQQDFTMLMSRLGQPAGAVQQMDPVLKMARKAREDLARSTQALSARLRLTRPPDLRQLRGHVPELRKLLEDSHSTDIKEMVINAASAPRRSLRKYHHPRTAQRLCLLPDHRLDTAAMRDWAGLQKSLKTPQTSLFTQSFSTILRGLDRELEAIHRWRSLPLPEVLHKYQELLT